MLCEHSHPVGSVCVVKATLQCQKRGAGIEPALQCCSGPLLPATAKDLFNPFDFIDHEAQSLVGFAFLARNTILHGRCIVLQLRQDENLNVQIHIHRWCHWCSWELRESVVGVCGVAGGGDARVKHGDIHSIIPLSANPSRVDSGGDGVGVVTIHTSSPKVTLQDDVLSLPWFQIESGHSNGESAIDGVGLKARQSFRLRSIAKLVIQRRVGLWQLGISFI